MKVIKIGAVWCPGCQIMRPRWAEVEKENPWLETEYLDYDQDREKVEKYKLKDSLPVFVFLNKGGEEILRFEGEMNKEKIIEIVAAHRDK